MDFRKNLKIQNYGCLDKSAGKNRLVTWGRGKQLGKRMKSTNEGAACRAERWRVREGHSRFRPWRNHMFSEDFQRQRNQAFGSVRASRRVRRLYLTNLKHSKREPEANASSIHDEGRIVRRSRIRASPRSKWNLGRHRTFAPKSKSRTFAPKSARRSFAPKSASFDRDHRRLATWLRPRRSEPGQGRGRLHLYDQLFRRPRRTPSDQDIVSEVPYPAKTPFDLPKTSPPTEAFAVFSLH